MKVWVADNGSKLRVFESRDAAIAWVMTFAEHLRPAFRVWCMDEREKAK